MQHTARYSSPLGELLLCADERGVAGLWFQGQRHFGASLSPEATPGNSPHLDAARLWLDRYFQGWDPGPPPPLSLGGTPFQLEVWALLAAIPYGEVRTYGALAGLLARRRGISHVSPRAVGSAVGRNPVSLLLPCHRVVGVGGRLTGYAGGLERKAALLALEEVCLSSLPPATKLSTTTGGTR